MSAIAWLDVPIHFRVHTPPSHREDFALVRSGSTATAPVAPNAEDFAPVLPWNDVAGSAVLRGHIGAAKTSADGNSGAAARSP